MSETTNHWVAMAPYSVVSDAGLAVMTYAPGFIVCTASAMGIAVVTVSFSFDAIPISPSQTFSPYESAKTPAVQRSIWRGKSLSRSCAASARSPMR